MNKDYKELVVTVGEVFRIWVPGPEVTAADPAGTVGHHAFEGVVTNDGQLRILKESHGPTKEELLARDAAEVHKP